MAISETVDRHDPVRILFFADSHLGFDLPARPRVKRRRRGYDFQANHERALEAAVRLKVDAVVHGGDVFHRSRVARSLAHQAFAPFERVADKGIPVFVVPGNHERSRMPHGRAAAHRQVRVFDRARTYVIDVRGTRVALAGFPYERRGVRHSFADRLAATGIDSAQADIRVLCMHHCVEGARVGPSDYTFRGAAAVVRARDLPSGVAAVLSGHIHRHQVLTQDLSARRLPAPVLYPGSVERTSVAEAGETKGFLLLTLAAGGAGGVLRDWRFLPLPARPLVRCELEPDGASPSRSHLERMVRQALAAYPSDAVVRLTLRQVAGTPLPWPSADVIRRLAPPSMNVDVVLRDARGARVVLPQRRRRNAQPRLADW